MGTGLIMLLGLCYFLDWKDNYLLPEAISFLLGKIPID